MINPMHIDPGLGRLNSTRNFVLRGNIYGVAFIDIVPAREKRMHIHMGYIYSNKVRAMTLVGDGKMTVYTDTGQENSGIRYGDYENRV